MVPRVDEIPESNVAFNYARREALRTLRYLRDRLGDAAFRNILPGVIAGAADAAVEALGPVAAYELVTRRADRIAENSLLAKSNPET